ncbi:MAG: circularly permuted type 2 ATP-grasp protein [Acidimicrobiia bacterium]|nr:circularly permuted type 2 ATP-grasp protein [Acidimicrobiia bacterium]MYB24442.1 circularly permuted type 2 ATP-grasp protein [Acidimicrobiia bacterium]
MAPPRRMYPRAKTGAARLVRAAPWPPSSSMGFVADQTPAPDAGLLDGYRPGPGFDEAFEADGSVREAYRRIVERFSQLDAGELRRLERLVADEFRRQGITFTVYSDEEGTERIWPMDLFPRLIAAAEWDELERGLTQRVAALNCFLEDLYAGEGAAIADGVVPRWLVVSSGGFERNAMGIQVPHGARCNVAGIDVVRDGEGRYRVLEDNLRNPSGISYVVENRAAMAKACSWLFYDHAAQPVEQYGRMLRSTLESMAPGGADSPHVVVLTPGIFNAAYFEHAFLARSMGVELVEGRDLVVDDGTVYVRTIEGLIAVDVIYRRVDDTFLDPVVFRPDSMLGVPGLLGALRAGTVTVCNALGNGAADDKAVYAYVPDLIRYYLSDEPIIDNVPTYLMWDPDQRAEALGRLDELVAKPVGSSGGDGVMIGPHADDEELAAARAAIEADPRNWITQEVVQLSSLPSFTQERLEPRHVDLRPFVLTGERTQVFPGGLTRVAMRRGSLIVNSSAGGGSKDTWVLAPEHQ